MKIKTTVTCEITFIEDIGDKELKDYGLNNSKDVENKLSEYKNILISNINEEEKEFKDKLNASEVKIQSIDTCADE